MHLPGMNFAGPGTNLDKRFTSTDSYKEWNKPIDRVDNASYHHDLTYKYFDDTANRNKADKIMIKEMDSIKNPTIRLSDPYDLGLSHPYELGLSDPYDLGIKTTQKKYKRSKKKKRKKKVIVNGIDEIWAADLVDMQSFSKFDDGIKYLLMVIDVFSKYGWIVPLKSKTGVDVANALNKIFHERKCQQIWVEKGLEFYNKHVKALGVELYSTENKEKSCVVERWNRTMIDKMFKYFSANSNRKYIGVSEEMVNKYNNTKHSFIKMTPVEASDKKNENIVWFNLNRNVQSESVISYGSERPRSKFSIGDRVRITKKKATFEKGYTPRWTEKVFTVSQVQFTDPPTYKLTDDNNEEIQGTFYEQEMQKTYQNIFRIEKVVRKLKNKSLVKWYGYHNSFNLWVDNKSDLIGVIYDYALDLNEISVMKL
ncbi:uncharacterized protein LOC136090495 [Hydra vulgaris]|uniref:Uncharacterized protein LOC136090495 n=1 Tax=Hydra vulgaris TaxID=6087 RepID=A0ABM4DFR4_HYDVU